MHVTDYIQMSQIPDSIAELGLIHDQSREHMNGGLNEKHLFRSKWHAFS